MSKPRQQNRTLTSTKFTAYITKHPRYVAIIIGAGVPLWVVISFYAANFLTVGIASALVALGVQLDVLRDSVLETIFSVVMYVLSLAITVGVPWIIAKVHPTMKELGLTYLLPLWRDVLWAPVVFVGAFLSSSITLAIVGQLAPWLNLQTEQSIGYEVVSQKYELLFAYLLLAVVGPIAEELLFRGYLHGILRKRLSVWPTIFITATTFALLHLGIGQLVEWQWNVAIDVFILSLWLGLFRERTGSVWVPIFVHMIKNTITFYVIFIATAMPLGGA